MPNVLISLAMTEIRGHGCLQKDVSEPGWRIRKAFMGFVRHLYTPILSGILGLNCITPTEELEHRALDAKTGKDER